MASLTTLPLVAVTGDVELVAPGMLRAAGIIPPEP